MSVSKTLLKLLIQKTNGLGESNLEYVMAITNTSSDQAFLQDLESMIKMKYHERKEEITRRISILKAPVNKDKIVGGLNAMGRASVIEQHFFRAALRGQKLDEDPLFDLNLHLYTPYVPYTLRKAYHFRCTLGLIPYCLIINEEKRKLIITCDIEQPLEGDDVDIANEHIDVLVTALNQSRKVYIDIQCNHIKIEGWIAKSSKRTR